MTLQLDAIDRRLLKTLQGDSRKTVQELGLVAGLSPSACHRRIKALEDAGVISGYHAAIDTARIGFTLQFFLEVSLSTQAEQALDAFEAAVRDIPEILECHLMAGQADYLLRVICRDAEDFERLHRRLAARLPGLARVQSNMTIRTVKSRRDLPI